MTTLSLQDVKEVQKAPSFLGVLGHKPLPDISQPPRSLISNSTLGSLSNIKTSSLVSLGNNNNISSSLLDSKTVASSIDSDNNIRNNIENSRTTEIAPSKDVGFVNSKLLSKFEPRYEIRGGNDYLRSDINDDSKGTTVSSSSYGNNNHQESKYVDI